jgi:short-subunit dehydrogenase
MPTALVTGASSGIGAAFARRLSADGYQVVAVARRQARLEQLRDEGGAAEIIVADLATAEGCALVEERIAAGGIDLLINNAGIGVGAGFDETSIEAEDRMLAVNVRAVMRLTHVAVPQMLALGRGEIINVSSIAAFTAVAGFATYSASKAYVVAMSESLAVRYAPRGVKVMALCPGYVRSEMHDPAEVPASGLQARLLWLDAEKLVDIALRDLHRGRVICMPGLPYKASVAVTKLLPRRAVAKMASFANRDKQ